MADEVKKIGIEIDVGLKGNGGQQAEQEIKAVTDAVKKDGEETVAASEKTKTALDEQLEAWRALKAEREANIKITDASGPGGDGRPVNLPAGGNTGTGLATAANLEQEAAATAAADQAAKTFIITTEAEYVAVQKAHAALSAKIPVMAALGKDTTELVTAQRSLSTALSTQQALAVSSSIEQKAMAAAAIENAAAQRVLEESTKLNSTALREMMVISRELGRGDFTRLPGSLSLLGQNLGVAGGLMLAGTVATVGLTLAYQGLKHASDAAAQAEADFNKAMEEGADLETASGAVGNFSTAISNSAVAYDQFKRALEGIKTAQASIKTETDAAVKSLKAEATAIDALEKSKLAANQADVRADFSGGKISKEEEIRRLNDLEDASANKKVQRDEATRAREIQIRQQELDRTKNAAATATAAVPAAEGADLLAQQNVERRKKLVESLQKQIEAAQKRDKEIIDQIGPIGFSDNSKTDFTSKLPGATSPEALRYQKGKSQVESDAKLIAQFQAQLRELDTPEAQAQYDVAAKKADEDRRKAEQEALKLNKRVAELETELNELKKENFFKSSVAAEVNANQQYARDTDAQAKVDAENQSKLKQDVETIQGFNAKETANPAIIAKAAAAINDIRDLLARHNELFGQLASLGISVQDIGHASVKATQEAAKANTIAQQAKAAADLH